MTEKEIQRKLEKISPRLELSTIETGSTCIGFPDTFYSYKDHCGVIELKESRKQRSKIIVPYRPGQRGWLRRNRKQNRYVFVLFWYDGIFYLINEGFDKEYSTRETLKKASLYYTGRLTKEILLFL